MLTVTLIVLHFLKVEPATTKNSLVCLKAKMNLFLLRQREKAQFMSQIFFEFFKIQFKIIFLLIVSCGQIRCFLQLDS